MTITIERHTHSCQYSSDGSTWVEFGQYVVGITTHHDDAADRGTVEIKCTVYPSGLAENNYLVCYVDGDTVFNGRVARPARNYYTEADMTVYGEGRGAYLAKNWKADGVDPYIDAAFDRVYTNMEDGAIITNLAEAAGVEVSMHIIQSSGILRGTIYDVILKAGQAFWSLIRGDQGMDVIAGYITFEDVPGRIVRAPYNVDPLTIADTAAEGTNILTATRTPRGTESIYNRAIVYGLEYEGATIGGIGVGDYSLPNSNIDGYNPLVLRTNMVESDSDALASATQIVNHNNFPKDEANITVIGNTGANVGQTWQLNSATLDYANDSSSLRWCAAVSHNYGSGVGFETALKFTRPTESW